MSSTAAFDEHLPTGPGAPLRHAVELDRDQALGLLASAPFGRVVYTMNALPAVRPVNHVVVDGLVVVRTRLTAQLSTAVRAVPAVVVAYQADEIDPVEHTGWSVVVTGFARTVTDPARIERYTELLRPWVNSAMDTVVTIEPTLVTGIRLVAGAEAAGPDSMHAA
ncbi:pyridoxamine 5'-phosphate oxidase family protein [Nocardia stercoris]|uniref:pyridoxamine 5'-phosphate oxidase family protein n=1 Tax=Nocardia stercoris TaxID=2483361 RepID=UPI001F20D5A0|nr:pyridoxamine 5'-phosphate oxidase family protein [Nocardia stercoris]